MRELYFYDELEVMYCELMNDAYEPYKIDDSYYGAGDILRGVEPAYYYRCVSDWVNAHYCLICYAAMTEEEREHYIVSTKQVMYVCIDEDM